MKAKRLFHPVLLLFLAIAGFAGDLQAAQVLFLPELRVTEEYSDNIFLTSSDKEDDFITTAGLPLTLRILGRTGGLELNYTPTYFVYAQHSDLDYLQHAGRARLWHDFRRHTRFELSDYYLESEDPTGFYYLTPETLPPGASITNQEAYRRRRARYRTNTADARLTHQFGTRDNAYAFFRYAFWKDIDTVAGVPPLDYQNWQPTLGGTYWYTLHWGTQLEAIYSKWDYKAAVDHQDYGGFIRQYYAFDQHLAAYLEYRHTYVDYKEGTDYHVFYPSVGARYEWEKDAFIRLGVGYYIQEFQQYYESNDGVSIDSELAKKWTYRSGEIDATASSGYTTATVASSGVPTTSTIDLGLTIYYQARLGALYRLTPHFSGEGSVYYRHNDYPGSNTSDYSAEALVGLRYRLLRWMEAGLSYRYRLFRSDVERLDYNPDYTENRVILSITLSPSTPFRWI